MRYACCTLRPIVPGSAEGFGVKRFVRRIVGLALVAMGAFATTAWTEEFDAEGDRIHVHDGIVFFGFVKDTNGASVSDAKVAVAASGRDAVITYTNSIGAYRANLGQDVDANAIVISCEKAGFKQVRAFRRTAPSARMQTLIETECTLMAEQ